MKPLDVLSECFIRITGYGCTAAPFTGLLFVLLLLPGDSAPGGGAAARNWFMRAAVCGCAGVRL